MLNILDIDRTFIYYILLNGNIVSANFGVHFLPCMKTIPKRTKMLGLTNTEFCKSQIQLR